MIYEVGTTTGSISDLIAAARKHVNTGNYLTFDTANNKAAILKIANDLISACNSDDVTHAILIFHDDVEPQNDVQAAVGGFTQVACEA